MLGLSKLGQMFCALGLSPIQAGVMVVFLGPLWFIFGSAKSLTDVGARKAKAIYEALKNGTKPAKYDPLVAYLAGALGTSLSNLPDASVKALAGVWASQCLIVVSLMSQPDFVLLKQLSNSAGSSLLVLCRGLSKRKVLQIEDSATRILASTRFRGDADEIARLEKLSISVGWLAHFCRLAHSTKRVVASSVDARTLGLS